MLIWRVLADSFAFFLASLLHVPPIFGNGVTSISLHRNGRMLCGSDLGRAAS